METDADPSDDPDSTPALRRGLASRTVLELLNAWQLSINVAAEHSATWEPDVGRVWAARRGLVLAELARRLPNETHAWALAGGGPEPWLLIAPTPELAARQQACVVDANRWLRHRPADAIRAAATRRWYLFAWHAHGQQPATETGPDAGRPGPGEQG